jgi:hypothetical protein
MALQSCYNCWVICYYLLQVPLNASPRDPLSADLLAPACSGKRYVGRVKGFVLPVKESLEVISVTLACGPATQLTPFGK